MKRHIENGNFGDILSVVRNGTVYKIFDNLSKVIKGKREVLWDFLIALLSGVNILLEDVPGVGKTTMAKGLSRSIRAKFKRIQFTPDLLPADVLGSSMYNPKDGKFYFREGPIFTNILLADEINRASPRTQSSLLEAMSEKQVTIEGVRYPLPDFFVVIATQNPVEYHGTYPLPEAQLDRFGMRLTIGYPDVKDEVEIFFSQRLSHPLDDVEPVASVDEILQIQEEVRRVKVSNPLALYIAEIAKASRNHKDLKLGISPRGGIMLYRVIQARAFIEGRSYATPDDVKAMAVKVLAHRIILNTHARYSGVLKEDVIRDIIDSVKVPI